MGDIRILVGMDSRRRVTLGRLGRPEHRYYLAHDEPDGTIVLVPAAVMPEAQARLLASSEVVERVERAVADPGSRARLGRPSRA